MTDPRAGWMSRQRVLALALIAMTAIVLYVCYRLIEPFLPALAWGVALAVVAHPVHRWVCRIAPRATVAAALSVLVVAVVVIGPVVFVTQQVVKQSAAFTRIVATEIESGGWKATLEQNPRLAPALRWVQEQVDVDTLTQRAGTAVQSRAPSIVGGSVWVAMQLLVTLFVLFYLFRDRRAMVDSLWSVVPLSDGETAMVLRRVTDTIHATIFGALTVAAVQGAMGGLMFWFLGLPAPLLWGTVMAVLATIPILGTFVVWAPAAGWLALNGHWGKAIILVAWGGVAIALIDNLLYPILVGGRLRLHPLPVFFSIVGGLFFFGAAGVILGPVTLAVAWALLDIWRGRTAFGQAADTEIRPAA